MKIKINPNNLRALCCLMDLYGDSEYPFSGRNSNGERILTSICRNHVTVETFQRNGWTRENVYWRDGTTEELFHR